MAGEEEGMSDRKIGRKAEAQHRLPAFLVLFSSHATTAYRSPSRPLLAIAPYCLPHSTSQLLPELLAKEQEGKPLRLLAAAHSAWVTLVKCRVRFRSSALP